MKKHIKTLTDRYQPKKMDTGQVLSQDFAGEQDLNLIGAKDDNDALAMFLNKAGTRSAETRRRYERETVRFTFFIYHELGIDYKGVRLKHLQAYLYFIQNLPAHWLKSGLLPGRPEKILFKASVSAGKSTDQVIDVLSAFFSFLEKNRYTIGNPAASLVRSGEKRARGSSAIRYFHDNEWALFKDYLDSLPSGTDKEQLEASRIRYIIAITYGLALRESEVALHSCADIHPDGEGGLYLSVLGKGRKRRHLPINENLQDIIVDFRARHGLSGIHGDNFPLAPRQRKIKGRLAPLSSRGLRFFWQSLLRDCARQLTDPYLSIRLQEIPFHALRHTALTHLARVMDIEDLAIFAGHDSINTTSQYYHAEAQRLRTLTASHGL